MVRASCCEKMGLKRGPWTSEEDRTLVSHIQKFGHANWRALPKEAGLLRCGKGCRLRWTNYLRPGIKRGNFSREEEDTIIQLHQMLGNRWSGIAARLPGRTDNEIKNVWHTHLKKRLKSDELTEKGLLTAAGNAGIHRREAKPAPADLGGSNPSTTVQHSTTNSEANKVSALLSRNNFSFSITHSSSMATSDSRTMISSPAEEESSMYSLDSNGFQSCNSPLFLPEDLSGMDELWLETQNEAHTTEDKSMFIGQNMVEPEFVAPPSPFSFYQDHSMDFWLNVLMESGQTPSALQF